MLRPRTLPTGFIPPCLPTLAPQPPSGEPWLHEIKHDGFRVIARKEGKQVKLYSHAGNDLTDRFALIMDALARLRSRSYIIDGEAVACGGDGIASFDRIRYRRNDAGVFLYAFDLIELDGDDLRSDPLAVRKATLASLLTRRTASGRALDVARFWFLDASENRFDLDGADWLIEGRRQNTYHAVHRWSPDGEIHDLGRLFFAMAGSPLADVKLY
jgi:ATP-dependent DNA ligase